MTTAELVQAACDRNGGPPGEDETFIYFMQAKDGGPIKIGRSHDPAKRLKQCQSGNPHALIVTHVEVAEPYEEWRLHQLFAEVRMAGEWFQPHPALAAIARAQTDMEDGPVLVNPEYADAKDWSTNPYGRRKWHQFMEETRPEREERETPEFEERYRRNIASRQEPLTTRPEPDRRAGWAYSFDDV